MIKFSIGYQLADEGEESTVSIVRDFSNRIAEVYFAWPGMASGRSPLAVCDGCTEWDGQARLEADLEALKSMGIKLHLLLNANCYGGESLSIRLRNTVGSLVAFLKDRFDLDGVTTTSLMVARTLREHFADLDVRASVNMRIGTVKGMEYVQDLFDSFNIQREYNRDLDRITELKEWADEHGKRLHMLANSGCLNFCSGQVFHDNLVAHEAELSAMRNIEGWNPSVCWHYYAREENRLTFLQNSWIRPEDIHHYEPFFPVVKLATRMHSNPRMVAHAYSEGKYIGNLPDLLEPGHGMLLGGQVIDNTLFPDDWWERTTQCGGKCHRCTYCREVFQKVTVCHMIRD